MLQIFTRFSRAISRSSSSASSKAANVRTTGLHPWPSQSRMISRLSILPQVFEEKHGIWRDVEKATPHDGGTHCIQPKTLLQLVSWNINYNRPGSAERAAAAMNYLHGKFHEQHGDLAIMLQEVRKESVQAILASQWIQDNFAVVGITPPRTFVAGIPAPAKYFTMMMLSKTLKIANAFRLPLPSEMGRDALFVDLPVHPITPNDGPNSILRLCTTHLESLPPGADLRRQQLEAISRMLHEDGDNVIAGIVAGDMNAVCTSDRDLPRRVGLRDAWETGSPKDSMELLGVSGDGTTWGHHPRDLGIPAARLDKFLYSGAIMRVALEPFCGPRPSKGSVTELGIGLTTEVPADFGDLEYVSDHFAIETGIKIDPSLQSQVKGRVDGSAALDGSLDALSGDVYGGICCRRRFPCLGLMNCNAIDIGPHVHAVDRINQESEIEIESEDIARPSSFSGSLGDRTSFGEDQLGSGSSFVGGSFLSGGSASITGHSSGYSGSVGGYDD